MKWWGMRIMDILNRILELRSERNWSEYQLAERSGITQSTISAWFRLNTLPTIPSLLKICDAFGITMSQFFMEDGENIPNLTPSQKEVLYQVSKLSEEQQNKLAEFLKVL